MISIDSASKCCGCYGCMNVCPVSAIDMIQNDEGFYYPFVDLNLCIGCEKCNQICPMQDTAIHYSSFQPVLYAGKNLDDKVRLRSSSGGLFHALADYVINQGGVVFGAVFDDDFSKVRHIGSSDITSLCSMMGSKYLQSDIGYNYSLCKDYLESDKLVLFTGTPCQIVALKNYLKIDYANLICLDVICHGVPSDKLWNKYLENYVTKKDSLEHFSFRAKSYKGRIIYQKGYSNLYFHPSYEDPFLRLYQSDCCLRESCYSCPIRSNYKSDLTLGDYWSINRVDPSLNDGKGLSLIIVRSNKGLSLLNNLQNIFIKEETMDESIKGNSVLEQTKRPVNRNEFYNDIDHMDLCSLANKYAPNSKKEKLKLLFHKFGILHLFNKLRKNQLSPVVEYGTIYK